MLDVDKYVSGSTALERQISFVRQGGEVKRSHTQLTLTADTVAAHSYGVAWFCYFLSSGNPSAALLMHALAHDTAEYIVGDIPAPAKRGLDIRHKYAHLEDELVESVGLALPSLIPEERQILAAADTFDLAFYCIKERSLGNRNLDGMFRTCGEYLAERCFSNPEIIRKWVEITSLMNREWEKVK